MPGRFDCIWSFFSPAYVLTVLLLVCGPCPAAEPVFQFDMPAGPLGDMLRSVGQKVINPNILFDPSTVAGLSGPALRGEFTAARALEHLLAGKRLYTVQTDDHTVMIVQDETVTTNKPRAEVPKREKASEATPDSSRLEEILVTAGYTKDLRTFIPTTTVTGKQLQDWGYVQIGEFFRQFPHNFPGVSPSSNPIVGSARGAGYNQTFSAGIDLLGFGPGTTLVLLNGYRLPSSVIGQSVDISAIPISAIDHIDIVAGGASAIYGSDAIAGVVNIFTISNYSGLEVTVRYGGTSEDTLEGPGGSVITGGSWNGGNGVMTFNVERDDALFASERRYTSGLPGPTSLLPAMRIYSVVANTHQELCERWFIRADVFASRRTFDADDALEQRMTSIAGQVDQWNAVVQVNYSISASWNLNLAGQIATERDRVITTNLPSKPDKDDYLNQAPAFQAVINRGLSQDSPRQVQIAFGTAFRQEQFAWRPSDAPDVINRRGITSVFGELQLPLFDEDSRLPFIQELSADLSGRYDAYHEFGSSWAPRAALRWRTSKSLVWRSGFSRSFRSPTLLELYSTEFAGVVPTTNPASPAQPLNILVVDGGSRRLTAERSRSVEFGVTYEPPAIKGMNIDVSAMDLTYTHRIDQLSQDGFSASQVIADAPVLGRLATLNPSPSQVQQLLNTPGLLTYTGVDVNHIAAIANLGFSNVGSTDVRVINGTVNYEHDIGGDAVTAALLTSYFANYIVRITPQSKPTSFVGTVYRPARLRAKLDLTWTHQNWTTNARWNFVGSSENGNDPACPSGPGCPVSTSSTFDAGVTYLSRAGDASLLHGIRVTLSVSNAFNSVPPHIYGGTHYDPANASPAGRAVGIALRKSWGAGRSSDAAKPPLRENQTETPESW
jgi:outer membrane cobalamin receptor